MSPRQVWKLERTGNIGDLRLRTEDLTSPGPGEVRIAVKAVGLNFADVFTCLGLYAAAPKSVVPGLEFSGVVEEIGPIADRDGTATASTSQLQPGDKVMGVSRFGAFSSHLNTQASLLQPMPDGWSSAQGAAFLVQGLTAMYGLRQQANLRSGQKVLVHSAAGGCGQFAMGICHAFGATPIATVGSADKVDFLLHRFPWLQRDHIVVRDASRFKEQLSTALQAVDSPGFDVVLDAVSGEFFQPGFDSLGPGGRYVIYGAANWTPTGDKPGWLRLALQYLRRARLDPLDMIGQNRAVMGFNLIYLFNRASELRSLAEELAALNLPPPLVAAEFPFEDAPAAVRHLQSGKATGKVVLLVEGSGDYL